MTLHTHSARTWPMLCCRCSQTPPVRMGACKPVAHTSLNLRMSFAALEQPGENSSCMPIQSPAGQHSLKRLGCGPWGPCSPDRIAGKQCSCPGSCTPVRLLVSICMPNMRACTYDIWLVQAKYFIHMYKACHTYVQAKYHAFT